MMRRHPIWSCALEIEMKRRELFRMAAREKLIDDPQALFAYHNEQLKSLKNIHA